MHLNSAGTSSVLQLPVAAHLIDVFQLEVETQEDKLIQAASSKSLCQQKWPVTRTLHQDRAFGFPHCCQDSFYQLSWRPTGMSHYLEPYLHYFLYHWITRYCSPIFCPRSKRETSRHITCLPCCI